MPSLAADPANPPGHDRLLCLAEHGHVRAMTLLGMDAYRDGKKTGNMAPALYWIRKAAHADFIPAQRFLAMIYMMGAEAQKDRKQAKMWSRRAERLAEAGGDQAETFIGEESAPFHTCGKGAFQHRADHHLAH